MYVCKNFSNKRPGNEREQAQVVVFAPPNDPLGENIGQMLANIQLETCYEDSQRNPQLPTPKTKFELMVLLYQGEIAGQPRRK